MSVLTGKRVAFTGRLASMTRPEAAALVRTHGGRYSAGVTRRTNLLVVGQEGWPLRHDGCPSRRLAQARKLQSEGCDLAIITEEEWLLRLDLQQASDSVHGKFNPAQLGALLKIPRDCLRSWIKANLLQPVDTVQGICYYDFQQVTTIRSLWQLTRAGVKLDTIRRSLEQLRLWIPGMEPALSRLNVLGGPGPQLLLRLDQGLVDLSGQLHLDFSADETPAVPAKSTTPGPARELWKRTCPLEKTNQLEEAAEAYRKTLLLAGPDPMLCYNLANVLYGLGQRGPAAERYRQAVEQDQNFCEAWNNLGIVLMEMNQIEEAVSAYQRALQAEPFFSDAHYNLADALETLGLYAQARGHWKEYLRQQPFGDWARYARERLLALDRDNA